MRKIEERIAAFCEENRISVHLSHDMPAGYDTAYGTYDVTINTLFLNTKMLHDAPDYEVYFYLFHELRHAMQYLRPELFDKQIQESRFYVILYNGTCFKLEGNKWRKVIQEGTEEFFVSSYMNLPYELDANTFAYEKVKEMCGDTDQLQELYRFWMPKEKMNIEELRMLFSRIDSEIMKG